MKTLIAGLLIDSDFDSGNLGRICLSSDYHKETKQISKSTGSSTSRNKNSIKSQQKQNIDYPKKPIENSITDLLSPNNESIFHENSLNLCLWTKPDESTSNKPSRNRTWFHFSVEIVNPEELLSIVYPPERDVQQIMQMNPFMFLTPENLNSGTWGHGFKPVEKKDVTVVFRMMNLNKVQRLFVAGMRPLFRFVSGNSEAIEKCDVRTDWNQIECAPKCIMSSSSEYEFIFEFTFSITITKRHYYAVPIFSVKHKSKFSKEESQQSLGETSKKEKHKLENQKNTNLQDTNQVSKSERTKVYFVYCLPYSYTCLQRNLQKISLEHDFSDFSDDLIQKNKNISFSISDNVSILDNPQRSFSETVQNKINEQYLTKRKKSKGIYFHRDCLCYSLDGRRLDLLTISSDSGFQQNDREDNLVGIFPDPYSQRSRKFKMSPPLMKPNTRYYNENILSSKNFFFISARVHPSETVSSYILDGFLEFILRPDDPRARLLRERYVFKVVPMVNPDGVARGHCRGDNSGVNLNRVYDSPDPQLHPTIYAIRKYISYIATFGSVEFYFDLHGHANKFGCFLFGNQLGDPQLQKETLAFSKLMEINCPWFETASCDFSSRGMTAKDRADESKEGSGRVAIYNILKIQHCYTFECNYFCSKRETRILSEYSKPPGSHSTPPSSPILLSRRKTFKKQQSPKPTKSKTEETELTIMQDAQTASKIGHIYTPTDFATMGRALALSALDLVHTNPSHPYSRVPASDLSSLTAVRIWAADQCHSLYVREGWLHHFGTAASFEMESLETIGNSSVKADNLSIVRNTPIRDKCVLEAKRKQKSLQASTRARTAPTEGIVGKSRDLKRPQTVAGTTVSGKLINAVLDEGLSTSTRIYIPRVLRVGSPTRNFGEALEIPKLKPRCAALFLEELTLARIEVEKPNSNESKTSPVSRLSGKTESLTKLQASQLSSQRISTLLSKGLSRVEFNSIQSVKRSLLVDQKKYGPGFIKNFDLKNLESEILRRHAATGDE
ncbi:Cytosolic carboxypeptidase-like protein 5 [Nowakowskiella sp. JEL0078]|nr:Cytosolic carboxypeptidase-like protein 5 [Nowakowskiella sp. JEL0078]